MLIALIGASLFAGTSVLMMAVVAICYASFVVSVIFRPFSEVRDVLRRLTVGRFGSGVFLDLRAVPWVGKRGDPE